jgi:AcrR family transcriptional regulator
MGITERRERERERRRQDILSAAWSVAEEIGWPTFSVERVATKAELGRATVYGYFDSLDALVEAMAEDALTKLSDRVAEASGLPEALDVPLRFSQRNPAAFALLFQQGAVDARPAFSTSSLERARGEARQILGALHRLVSSSRATLPADAAEAQAFLAGIAMAGVAVPELRSNTPLRRRWQDFCLAVGLGGDGAVAPGRDARPSPRAEPRPGSAPLQGDAAAPTSTHGLRK